VRQGITTLLNTVPSHIDLASIATELQVCADGGKALFVLPALSILFISKFAA
jgi:hypothetical protein